MKYLIAIIGLFVFTGTAEATFHKPHNEWGKMKVSECEQIKCGNEAGKITYTIPCNSVNSWGINKCKEAKVWTKDCKVEEVKQCEPEGICPTECGKLSSEVADGQGGTKVCEATPACIVPVKDKDNGECDGIGKINGFRPFGMSLLKWNEKRGAKWIDIRVYDANKKFLYNVRTPDNGKYDIGGLGGYYFKVRGVSTNGICPLGDWTKRITF